MKKIKSKNCFKEMEPIGIAGMNKAFRKDFVTFEPVKTSFIDRIQNFYQLILQNLKVLYP